MHIAQTHNLKVLHKHTIQEESIFQAITEHIQRQEKSGTSNHVPCTIGLVQHKRLALKSKTDDEVFLQAIN